MSDGVVAAVLFAFALCTYWLSTGTELYGDETWYFYLARTFGREPAAAVDHPLFHLLNRPLYYALYHFGTYAGIPGFRSFACALAAITVVLCFGVGRALGATQLSAAWACIILALERQLVEWGAHGFPDVLASAFALAAVYVAWRGRATATCVLACCCVLSKESFVALPVIATAVRLWPRERAQIRLDRWAWATLVLPTAWVGCVTLFGKLTPGVLMQGWSTLPMSWKFASSMWVGPLLWPLIGWLALQKQWRLLATWLGLPAFYVLWTALGHGVSPWYATGPAYLSAVAFACAAPAGALAVRQRFGARASYVTQAFFLMGLLPIAASGSVRAIKEVRALGSEERAGAAASNIVRLIAQLQPKQVLLVHCFWAYGYAPLRAASAPALRMDWPVGEDLSSIRSAARAADLTILCRSSDTATQEQRLADGMRTLHVERDFHVLR